MIQTKSSFGDFVYVVVYDRYTYFVELCSDLWPVVQQVQCTEIFLQPPTSSF